MIVNITCSFSSDSTRNNLFQNSSEKQQIFQKSGRRRLLRKAIPKTASEALLVVKKYTDAKEWCENGAKNGFKAGRLYEPKSQSFNDKVNAKLLSQTWIGITLVKQGPRKNRIEQNRRTHCLGKCNWGTQWIMEIRSNE